MNDSMIVKTIRRYHPDWEPPDSYSLGKWVSCLCPFHGDSNKSASISFSLNAFNCFVCDAGGDVIKIIRQQEGGTFAEALRIAEGISDGSYKPVSSKPARKSRRPSFGEARADEAGDSPVRAGVRGRSTPWT